MGYDVLLDSWEDERRTFAMAGFARCLLASGSSPIVTRK